MLCLKAFCWLNNLNLYRFTVEFKLGKISFANWLQRCYNYVVLEQIYEQRRLLYVFFLELYLPLL